MNRRTAYKVARAYVAGDTRHRALTVDRACAVVRRDFRAGRRGAWTREIVGRLGRAAASRLREQLREVAAIVAERDAAALPIRVGLLDG